MKTPDQILEGVTDPKTWKLQNHDSGPTIDAWNRRGNGQCICDLGHGSQSSANGSLILRASQNFKPLVEALRALLVSIDCGKHEMKLEHSNPLCVSTARAALNNALKDEP